jgi:hypothetical protein
MLKISKLIDYSIDMCQSYGGITIVKFLYNGGTDPHPLKKNAHLIPSLKRKWMPFQG